MSSILWRLISSILDLLLIVSLVRLPGRLRVLRLSVEGSMNSSIRLSFLASRTSNTGKQVRSTTPLRLVIPAIFNFLQHPNITPLVLRSVRLGLL